MRWSAMRSSVLAVPAGVAVVHRRAACMLVAFALFAGTESPRAQMPSQKISGEIVRLDGIKLEVRSPGGALLGIRLADNVRLSARSAADPGMLTPGAYVGTTAVAQPDGTLLAREVHIFPEAMRGTGEGHRPMDEGSTMTNATIAGVGEQRISPRGTMTDATVTDVSAAMHGRSLTLRYKGGEKVVVVPDNVPVLMLEPADRSLLAPGAHVVVTASPQPDGSLVAERVVVGKNGIVPPP